MRRCPVTPSAAPAKATKMAATGLPSPESAASIPATTGRPRWAARSAPSPMAVPSAKVRRFAMSIVTVAAPSHAVAIQARSPKRRYAITPNSTAVATTARAPTTRTPRSAPSGGNSTLYVRR